MFSRKDLIRLFAPLLVEQLLAVLVGMADVVMVAAVGETAVSGVALVDSISVLVIQVLSAMATGGAVVCSQYIGKKKAGSGVPGGRAAGADHSGALAFHRGGGIYRKPAFAAADLRFGGDGGYGQRADILLVHRYVVSISGALQFRGGTVSVHGKFQGVHEGFSGNECHQCGGQRALRVRASYGSGRRGNSYPGLTSVCGSGHGVPGAESKNSIRVDRLGQMIPQPDMIKKILAVGIPSGLENGMFQFGKNRAAESGFDAWHGIHCRLRGGHQPGDVSVSAGSGAGTGAHHHCGPVCGRGRTGTGKVLHEKGHCGQLRTVTYHLYLHGGVRSRVVGIYNLSPEASVLAQKLLLAHSCGMVLWPLAFALPNTLRAGLDAKFTMMVSVFSMWVFRIGLSYVFVRGLHMSVLGIWYAMFVDWIFRLVVFVWRFKGFTARVRQV